MNRKELINKILTYSQDEFETKQDYIDLAYKSKKQLMNDVISINNYLLNNK
jgi:hypothetical protein